MLVVDQFKRPVGEVHVFNDQTAMRGMNVLQRLSISIFQGYGPSGKKESGGCNRTTLLRFYWLDFLFPSKQLQIDVGFEKI